MPVQKLLGSAEPQKLQLGTGCIHLWLDHYKTSACSDFQECLLMEGGKMWMFLFLVSIPLNFFKLESGNKVLSGLAMKSV